MDKIVPLSNLFSGIKNDDLKFILNRNNSKSKNNLWKKEFKFIISEKL